MLNEKAIKAIGIATTLVGVGVSLVSNWVNDKNLDAKIAEKVAKAVTENAVKTERTESQINKLKENIKKLSSFKQINNNFLHENNYELYNVNTPIFNPL